MAGKVGHGAAMQVLVWPGGVRQVRPGRVGCDRVRYFKAGHFL